MSKNQFGFSRRTALVAFAAAGSIFTTPVVNATINATANKTSHTTSSDKKATLEQASEALRIAMLEGNSKALNSALHDDLNYMHSSGRSQTKANVLDNLAGKRFFAALDYSEQTTDVVGDTGLVTLTVDQTKNLEGGKTRASRIKVMHTWVYLSDQWQLLARSSAIIFSPLMPQCNAVKPPVSH